MWCDLPSSVLLVFASLLIISTALVGIGYCTGFIYDYVVHRLVIK